MQQYARPPYQVYPGTVGPYPYPAYQPATATTNTNATVGTSNVNVGVGGGGNNIGYPQRISQQQLPLVNSNTQNLEQTQMLQIRTVSAELENQGTTIAPPAEAMKEVKLINNNKEREMYDNLADLYAIIKTLDHLEKAYLRDAITANDYNTNCTKLINQYKTVQNLVKDVAPDLTKFMQEYRMDCKAASQRVKIGVSATVEHRDPNAELNKTAMYVAETVQYFITAMDSLKLNMAAVDQVQPLIQDLVESLNRVPSLPHDFEGKEKLKSWLIIMNKMKASDELNPEQTRQLLFDLETAYTAFHKHLK